MSLQRVDTNIRTELMNLIKGTHAFFPSEHLGSVFPIVQGTDYLFELDRLWSKSDIFKKSVKLIGELIKSTNIHYSTIAGLTSRTGAFGTVPLCAGIALKYDKHLLVFDEERFSNYNVHPDAHESNDEHKGERIILVKDVILRGDTIERALETIKKLEANLCSIVVLVDLNVIGESRYSMVPKDIPIFVLADGPFPELQTA
jgi:orotate phosphoribosyltransferase